jgi:TPR repeat protein
MENPSSKSTDVRALILRGWSLRDQGKFGEAEQVLRQAAATGDPDATTYLGVVLGDQGKLGEAEQVLRQAAATGHRKAMLFLGALLREQGNKREAWQWWRKAAASGVRGVRPTVRHKGSGLNQSWSMGWKLDAGGGSARRQVAEMGEEAAELAGEIAHDHGDHGHH